MISIGIDAVEISRFILWKDYSVKKLSRIFAPDEIDYCLAVPVKSAERFAVRFAAKEALYKALTFSGHRPIFLTLCKKSSVSLAGGFPSLQVDWGALSITTPLKTSISLTHSRELAIAVVVLA